MSMLPNVSDRPAVRYDYFPTLWQAVLFRNWTHVSHENLAQLLGTTVEVLRREADALGLDSSLEADPRWLTRGYLTIIRENWHLLTMEQIAELLEITSDRLAFLLKEDDFLWHKMGKIKPRVEDVCYSPLTDEQTARTAEIRKVVRNLFPNGIHDNAFQFIDHFMRPLSESERNQAIASVRPDDSLRTVYSYFALYGDPLIDPSLDPFPEALLAEYARMGVKGVWLQGVLYQLVEFPFAPEISEGWEMRIASLRNLVQRAAKYGIGVYLYLNEPRAMNAAFFEKYPNLRGKREGDFYAMCTSHPDVQAYLEDAVYRLFSQCPGLAGFFTITMSENLTNCYSRLGDGIECPRCAQRKPEEVIAEVNNLMARGAKRANPHARAIAWNWAWGDEWATKVPPLLTEGQIVQCTSEDQLETNIAGVKGRVSDYTLSLCGPGDKAKSVWQSAIESGLEACAKTQFNNTWEMSAAPWLPVFDKVAQHISNLQALSVKHYQMSWTLGGFPSPNLKLAAWLMEQRGTVHDFLRDWLGEALGNVANEGQKLLSKAFSEFPFHISTLYTGPQNFGPMAPFFDHKTDWTATMVGFPYDDLDSWRSIYSRDQFRDQFAKLVSKWSEGVEILDREAGINEDFDDMLRMARAALCHFTSTLNHMDFIMARESGKISTMLRAVNTEQKNVQNAIALRSQDSRIGYEASNHYFYSLNDLAEKMINLSDLEEKMKNLV